MIIKTNGLLQELSSLRIGGLYKTLYIPESIDELIKLLDEGKGEYLIGGGSNILINDKREFNEVICLRKFNNTIVYLENGKFEVGASVVISKFIKFAEQHGYGGLESLFGIPCLIGGAIVSNCGYGDDYLKSIGAFVESVKVYDNGKVIVLKNNDCHFSYRDSIFKRRKYAILSAVIKLNPMNKDDIEDGINRRVVFNREYLNETPYTLGSVFCKSDSRIMALMYKIRRSKGCRYSRCNMIGHCGDGTYHGYLRLLNDTVLLHRLLKKKCTPEIVVWK